jgi:signal peptidase II
MTIAKVDGKHFFFFLTALIIVLFDQIIKYIVLITIPFGKDISVVPYVIQLTHILNTGAGFGILQGKQMYLAIISIIFVGVLLYYYPKIRKEPIQYIPYALILGGALGNLIDRLFREGVVDFIRLIFVPAFNLADSAISIGAVWIIILAIIEEKKKSDNNNHKRNQKE